MAVAEDHKLPTLPVVGFPVAAVPFDDQIDLMMQWARQRLSKVVCIANVHMLVEAYQDQAFATVLENADLTTPDGMPLVWMLRWMGISRQDRVAGLDVLIALCKRSSEEGIPIFFLGANSEILEGIKSRLQDEFPRLELAGLEPLPFRPLTQDESHELVQRINASKTGFVFVALGCPKQEWWMYQHKNLIQAVMIGLGGAFPVYAGIHSRAPKIIRSAGFEWLYRLAQEPGRLWFRYATTIPVFLWLALRQFVLSKRELF